VFKAIDSRTRVQVDTIEEGKMIGVASVIYECNPFTSVEALSYCTIATIPNFDFKEMMCFFPEIKQPLVNSVLDNPYDLERDFVAKVCMQQIPYFSNLRTKFLRTVYYRSAIRFYDQDSVIFDVNQECKHLLIVLTGVI